MHPLVAVAQMAKVASTKVMERSISMEKKPAPGLDA